LTPVNLEQYKERYPSDTAWHRIEYFNVGAPHNDAGIASKGQLTRQSLNAEGAKTVKPIVLGTAAVLGLFVSATLISNLPVRVFANDGNPNDLNGQSEIQQGFAISPVKLNLDGKNPALVGLGSYIVNAQGGCNDCHTCPSYAPGQNPYPKPFGDGGNGQFNSTNYMAGGVDFGIAVSANLTPDVTGKPEGLTLAQFKVAIRTGHDPLSPPNDVLLVMPWPIYRFMTDRDLDAVYEFLSAIPPASPGHCTGAGQ
jgi:hypothetical protein